MLIDRVILLSTLGLRYRRVKAEERLSALDALRGLAALAVVLFHIPSALRNAAGVPPWLEVLFANGFLGVDVFFVLSGFVIAMSMRSGPWDLGFLGRFGLRRSLRLDPPYWTAICVEVFLGWLGVTYLNAPPYAFPTPAGVAAHFTYTQGLLGYPHISDVFWTLCYEIQFYLVLVSLVVLAHLRPIRSRISPRYALGAALLLLVGWSLLIRSGFLLSPWTGLALERVYQFGAGVLVYLCVRETVTVRVALTGLAAITVARLAGGGGKDVVAMLMACGVCYGSARYAIVNRLAQWRPLQFLGRTSYSLYLFHASVVGRVSSLALSRISLDAGPIIFAAVLCGAVLSSIIFSALMHHAIELPSLVFSRRIRLWVTPRPTGDGRDLTHVQ